MDATDPVARAHHQLRDDLELVVGYGRDEAAGHFGGCYWDNQPPVTIVALFTAEVDRHQMVLGRRVTQPARLVVRATPGTWRQLQADHEEITAMLLTTRTEPGVHSVGIGLRGGRFVVCVDIEPYTAQRTAHIAALCSPTRSSCSQAAHTTPSDPWPRDSTGGACRNIAHVQTLSRPPHRGTAQAGCSRPARCFRSPLSNPRAANGSNCQ
jgi:hypothetical protein